MEYPSKSVHSLEIMNFAPESETEEADGIFVSSLAPITSEILFQVVDEFELGQPQHKIENSLGEAANRISFMEMRLKNSAFASKKIQALKNNQTIKNFGVCFDKLKFRASEISQEISCGLCGGVLRKPFLLSGCFHNFCKLCIARWLKEGNKKCPCGKDIESYIPNRILQAFIFYILYSYPIASPRLDKAYELINSLSTMNMQESQERQRKLFNYKKTTVFRIVVGELSFGFETSGEFCIQDIYDLILRRTPVKGTFACKGRELDHSLMIGFVDAFIWRESNALTLNLV
ncbi:unnamed protein product [Blepharisma stoltei]|uniref:RING-type domain-containing protein n=1 Tax=Blepharisma stoltei TaxID=1481888 RepID=A0AAU9JZZ0_9CILI|nr:unnamed protein product [Blepharisma stoltei]